LLEELKKELLVEPRTCYLGDRTNKVRDLLDDLFESVVSNLRAHGPLAYTDNECGKQLLYALDDHVWGMKSLPWKNLLI
jgi:hypothetical protein